MADLSIVLRNTLQLLVILTGIIFLATGYANAAQRVALVIGNSEYKNASSLPNPTNDADAMAQMLRNIGFEVNKLKDVGYTQMRLALREFSSRAATADIALIFYAGHGMEVNKHNYLIPSDAILASDRDIDFETVPLDLVTQAAGGARVLSLVLLDACRNNPFAASMKRTIGTRSIGRGLAKVEPTAGTLISFAAKEGTVAADGNGKNSPYTTALLKHLEQPGLEINILFRKVRDAVLQDTGGNQEPFTYASLPGDQIYLVEPVSNTNKLLKTNPAVTTNQNQSDTIIQSEIERIYTQIKNTKDLELLKSFAKKYSDSFYAAMVNSRIRELTARQIKVVAAKQKAIGQSDINKTPTKLKVAVAKTPTPDINGIWNGYATSGSTKFSYRWDIRSFNDRVDGTISISRLGRNQWNTYSFEGDLVKNTVYFEGIRWLKSSGGSFCLASGQMKLSTVGGKLKLSGRWGQNSRRGGCPAGASGQILLDKAS